MSFQPHSPEKKERIEKAIHESQKMIDLYSRHIDALRKELNEGQWTWDISQSEMETIKKESEEFLDWLHDRRPDQPPSTIKWSFIK